MLALHLPPDLDRRLDELARKTGRTKDSYVREALAEHIDDLEDLYLAEQRMRDNPEFVSLAEVMAKYGVDSTRSDEK